MCVRDPNGLGGLHGDRQGSVQTAKTRIGASVDEITRDLLGAQPGRRYGFLRDLVRRMYELGNDDATLREFISSDMEWRVIRAAKKAGLDDVFAIVAIHEGRTLARDGSDLLPTSTLGPGRRATIADELDAIDSFIEKEF